MRSVSKMLCSIYNSFPISDEFSSSSVESERSTFFIPKRRAIELIAAH